jgi:phage replication-related protein YjqB (UPF0714/DUF867 family)
MHAARGHPVLLSIAALFVGSAWAFVPDAPPPPPGPSFDGAAKVALKTQKSLLKSGEHCSADPDQLRTIGRGAGQQVRIYRGSADLALFTVSETRDETPETIVRIAKAGRERLGTDGDFAAHFVAAVPNPTLSDADAKAAGDFVERLDGDVNGGGLLLLAPHGGDIEPSTDLQVERIFAALSGKPVVAWRCKGYDPRGTSAAFSRWHITANDTSEASFPKLATVATHRYAYTVAFHGMSDPGILIGGNAPIDLKAEIKTAIEAAVKGADIAVTVDNGDSSIGGHMPNNLVNRYCDGTGVQIEQSPAARKNHWQAIADAVAGVYATRP